MTPNKLFQAAGGLLAICSLNVYAATIPCAADQTKIATAALANAKVMLDSINGAIKNEDPIAIDALTKWMGVASSTQKRDVLGRLETMRNYLNQTTFICDNMSHANPKKNIFASVLPGNSYQIKLGVLFFQTAEYGLDSQPGVIVHEFSHFLLAGGGTVDTDANGNEIYGPQKVQALAKTNPAAAQKLADAYEYVVESFYFKL